MHLNCFCFVFKGGEKLAREICKHLHADMVCTALFFFLFSVWLFVLHNKCCLQVTVFEILKDRNVRNKRWKSVIWSCSHLFSCVLNKKPKHQQQQKSLGGWRGGGGIAMVGGGGGGLAFDVHREDKRDTLMCKVTRRARDKRQNTGKEICDVMLMYNKRVQEVWNRISCCAKWWDTWDLDDEKWVQKVRSQMLTLMCNMTPWCSGKIRRWCKMLEYKWDTLMRKEIRNATPRCVRETRNGF